MQIFLLLAKTVPCFRNGRMRAGVVTLVSKSMTNVERRYAKIEKKALVITWICERLADYFVGLQFHIHTDYKPLIYLFSADKSLDAVSPRI